MSDIKIRTVLDGVPRLIRQLQLANTETRDRTKAAIRRGTEAVVGIARATVHKRSGELAYTIRGEYSKDAMVGYAKSGYGSLPRRSRASTQAKRARLAQRRGLSSEERRMQFRLAPTSKQALAVKADLGVYAPVVERGDPKRHHKKHPFLVPALMTARGGIIADLARATHEGAASSGLAP